MRPPIISLTCLLLFLCTYILGQTGIAGKVTTPDNKPLPFVSVTVMQDSNFIVATVTDETGHFHLSANFSNEVTYTIKLSLVGYQPLAKEFVYPNTNSLSHLVMVNNDHTLDEVIVSSKKPLITRKADRYIVNVENSYLATGNSALDVLQKSPGLWVSPNGSIRITGSQSVTVMINDVVQRMSETELADYLRSLRSEDISKIEIIPNPPSEFEASSTGGIVHIILKKARKDGLTGTVVGQYRQQVKDPSTSAGISMDFKLQKIYLFGRYSFGNDQSRYTGTTFVKYPDESSLLNDTKRTNNNTRQMFRAGVAYDFSANHSINIQTIGTTNKLLQHFRSDLYYDMPLDKVTGLAQSDWTRKPQTWSTTLNYAWKIDTAGSSLKVIADYTTNDKTELNALASVYSDATLDQTYRTSTPSSTDISSIQADYTKAMARKTAFKSGIKYVFTGRDNTIITERYNSSTWAKDSAASNEFRYTEALLMFYGSFEKTVKKTSIKGGLRGEMTWSEGHSITSNEFINKNYFALFPSVFIGHTFNEEKGNFMHLDYSRRVRRPGYNDLNPYRLQVHDFTVLTGNPDLVPQYTHNIRTGYTFRNKYTADIYFQSTHNFIAQTANTVDSNIIEYKSKNYRRNIEYGLSMNGSFTVAKIWNIQNNLLFYHVRSNFDNYKMSENSFAVQSIHTISLKKIMDIDVYAEYVSPRLSANSRQFYLFYTDVGFTRRILKGNGRLRLYFSDITNTFREKDVTQYDNTRIDFYQKRPTRTVSLTFSYNFKAGKAFTKKKIDPNNSDEKNRL